MGTRSQDCHRWEMKNLNMFNSMLCPSCRGVTLPLLHTVSQILTNLWHDSDLCPLVATAKLIWILESTHFYINLDMLRLLNMTL